MQYVKLLTSAEVKHKIDITLLRTFLQIVIDETHKACHTSVKTSTVTTRDVKVIYRFQKHQTRE